MILDSTVRSIVIYLGEAKTTNDCDISAAYADITTTTFTPIANTLVSNGATKVTVVAAPAASTQRVVREIRFHNNDTVTHTVNLAYDDNGTYRIMKTRSVSAGNDFIYMPDWDDAVTPQGNAGGDLAGSYPNPTVQHVHGVTTNSSASAGLVGEYITSTVLIGANVALSNGSAANVTNISLTAGDWDIRGNVATNPAGGTTETTVSGYTSSASASFPTIPNSGGINVIRSSSVGAGSTVSAGIQQVLIGSTTTMYLGALVNFSGSTDNAYGFVGARRVQ